MKIRDENERRIAVSMSQKNENNSAESNSRNSSLLNTRNKVG